MKFSICHPLPLLVKKESWQVPHLCIISETDINPLDSRAADCFI